MFEGSFQPTNTAIHYAECSKRIEEMGMHYSMKRFITAIMMVENIKTINPHVINSNLVLDDEWPIDGHCLGTKKYGLENINLISMIKSSTLIVIALSMIVITKAIKLKIKFLNFV